LRYVFSSKNVTEKGIRTWGCAGGWQVSVIRRVIASLYTHRRTVPSVGYRFAIMQKRLISLPMTHPMGILGLVEINEDRVVKELIISNIVEATNLILRLLELRTNNGNSGEKKKRITQV
jgi:hypothetical protein